MSYVHNWARYKAVEAEKATIENKCLLKLDSQLQSKSVKRLQVDCSIWPAQEYEIEHLDMLISSLRINKETAVVKSVK